MTKAEAMKRVLDIFVEVAPHLSGPTVEQVLLVDALAEYVVASWNDGMVAMQDGGKR